MRRNLGVVPPNPLPMGPTLPALYQEDPFSQRLTAAFDAALAPVLATLDNLGAYLDPDHTPDDFLEWLGGWVGIAIDETWDLERRRTAISRAVEIYRTRGTVPGLAAQVEILTGGEVEIVENGAAGWSRTPGAPMPGKPAPNLVVRVWMPAKSAFNEAALDALVVGAKPAHLPHRLEVVTT